MTRLFANVRGNTSVEFAMVAPVFLSMLFMTVEGGRMVWTNQALKDVAFATARCMSVDTASCGTDALRRTFAVTHAARSGIVLNATDVVIQTNVTCDGNVAQNRVTVTEPFNSPVTELLEAMPDNIVTHACFPVLS